MKRLVGALALLLAFCGVVYAQGAPPPPIHVQQNTTAAGAAPNYQDVSNSNPLPVSAALGSAAGLGITAAVSASAEASHVLKATPGNLYSVYATNLTATTGFLVVLNAIAAPNDGAITPIECIPLPGNATASISYGPGPPSVYSAGIVAVVTSANTCFTKTTGVITAFIHGAVQ